MSLAQDNDVIHALAPDRPDQPFGKAILPRRGWCGRSVPDAHGAQSACDDAAIDPVPIADEVARSLIPRKCLRYLTRNPFGRRICCDVGPDEVSAAESDDDEGIEQVDEVAKRANIPRCAWLGRSFAVDVASISSAHSSPSLRRRNVSAT